MESGDGASELSSSVSNCLHMHRLLIPDVVCEYATRNKSLNDIGTFAAAVSQKRRRLGTLKSRTPVF